MATEMKNYETAVFAAGCFWGVQYYFSRQEGVLRTEAGYIGGDEAHPDYAQVKAHRTGHLEAVRVEFDPQAVSYEELCKLFFEIHDPGQLDGQGPDLGPQYLSGIFYADAEQRRTAEALIARLRRLGHEVNTVLEPFVPEPGPDTPVREIFWSAEDYHQLYYDKEGGSPYCHFRVRKF